MDFLSVSSRSKLFAYGTLVVMGGLRVTHEEMEESYIIVQNIKD